MLYVQWGSDTASVRIIDIRTGETETLGVQARWARYLPTGHLLLGTPDGLRAVAFDARRLAVV